MVLQPPSQTIINSVWKILIIDDDEDDFIITRDMLKEAKGRKFDVHWANTFEHGRSELVADHYHAVLVDYDLGVHSGIELIREANEQGYAAPLILFTGRGNYEVDVEAMEAGATLYLTKSEANPLLLERAIRYAIELKHKERTLRQSEAQLRASEAALRQSEAALRESEAALQKSVAKEREKLAELNAVLDATPAIVWITHDTKAEEVVGNQAAHDFLRVPPGKNLSKSAPVDAPRNFQVYRDGQELTPEELPLQIAAATGQPIRNFEEEIVFEDGDRAFLLGNVTPLVDDDGKPCGAVGAFINITERKQAEDDLRVREATMHRLETRWNAAIESIDVGVIIATEDEQVIYWNPAARQMHSFTQPDEGIEPLEQTPITFQLWTPDGTHLLALEEWPMRRIKRGEPVRNLELRIRRPDQGWEKIFSYSGTMVDTAGGERLIFLTCLDLTEQRRVEAALREGEERLRFALDAARMVAWEYDPATLKVALSENAEAVLELPQQHENSDRETIQVSLMPAESGHGYGLIHPDDVEKHRALVTQAIETGGSYMSVYRHAHPDRIIWLEEHGRAVVDRAGKTVGLVGVVQNITDRKQAEETLEARTESLRESERKFSTLFQKAAYAAILGSLPDSTVVDVNEAWEKLYGYTRIEAIGKTIPELNLVVDPEQRPRYLAELMQNGFVHDYELQIRVKSGEVRTMRVNFDVLEIDGKPYTLNTSYDITAFKQAEAALRQSEEKYAKSFRSSPAAIAISTLDEGRFTEVNDQFTEIFGYAREEMIGHTSTELGMYPDPAERKNLLHLIEEAGRFRDYEIRLLTRQGEPRDLLFSGERIEVDGQAYLLALILDVTERKQAEQQIMERESRLREFLESTHDTFFALDREWRFTYANHQFGELMGVNPQSVISKNYWEMFPHYLGTDIEQNYRQVMADRVPLHFRRQGVYTNFLYETSLYPTQEGLAVFSIDRTEELRYQQQLENERARLEAVLATLPVGVWITDADGRIVGKNERADQIWAGDAPMVEKVDLYPVYQAWDTQTGKKLESEEYPMAVALQTGQRMEKKELRIQRFNGSEGFVLVSAAPIKDGDGNLLGVVGINLDITERKQAEQALKQAEEKFSKAFLYNPVALTITHIADGRYLEVNEAFYQLTGYAPAEIVGHTVSDIALYVEPGKRAEMVDRIQSEGHLRNYEIEIRTKTRAIRTILTSIDSINIGGETCILTTFMDITERKETEQALRESEAALRKSEAMLRDFLENSQESFFILDRDWHIQYINRNFAEILHTSLDALAGKTFWEAFPSYAGTPVEHYYHQVMNERVPVRFEMGGLYSPIWFDINVYPTQEGIGVFAINRTEEKRAREALLESRERLKRAQQIAHLGSWELDIPTNRLTWSDEVYRIFGLQPQEFAATYEAFLEHVHPEDRTAVDHTYVNSIKENLDGYEMEHRVIRAHTGEVRFVHEKCEHLRDADGLIIRSIGMVHDITERKQAEIALQERNEALRASEALLEAFFANSPGILNIEDENFRYLKTDPMTPTYFGLDRQSIVGKAVKDLSPEFIENFGPMLRRVIETGQTESREVYSPVPGRPGEITYWQASYFPVPLPGGKRGIGVMGVEITGQKKTEQALELERAKLAAAIEEIPVGVCIGDAQGNVLSLNHAGLRLHDFSSEAEMFSRVENYLQEFELRFLDGRALPLDAWPSSKALRGDFVQNYEVILHHLRTGKERIVAYSAAPIKNDGGETILIVYTLQDLTERKEAEVSLQHYAEKLERSNQALQEFAFIASHDLQEPLRKIVMFGNSLRRQLCDSSDGSAQDYLGRMQSAAERMQTMIQGLLELSRISTRGGTITRVRLNQLATEVISDLEVRIKAVNGRVEIGELPSIEADELQMRQLFQNLIGNALKFHKPDVPPFVRISGTIHKKTDPSMVEIRVEDNGIGFDQEHATRIFQPFQRLHGRNEYEGTGLGLAICQKIVERHHGTIEVESVPGKGSTFIVRLPLYASSSDFLVGKQGLNE